MREMTPEQHGTYGGYKAHRRRGESACGPCLAAKAAYRRAQRALAAARRPPRAFVVREPTPPYPNRRVHVDDVELLASAGEHPDSIAQRLGVARMSLYRALHRHGRGDLVARLTRSVAA